MARDAEVPPSEFLTTLRRKFLSDELRRFNELNIGVIAEIDPDGDVQYHFTDLAALYRYYQSVGYPPRSTFTPETLAAHMTENSIRNKQERNVLREIASTLRDALVPAHPRLIDVPVDIIPISHVNAWAQPIPAGGDAIGLNRHFLRTSVWCDWFAWRWLESQDSLWEIVAQPEQVVTQPTDDQLSIMLATHRLARALMGKLPDGDIWIDSVAEELQQHGKAARGDLYAQMLSSIAIAHEFGHIALGHTDWLREIIEDDIRGRPLAVSHQELGARLRRNEYAADEFAAHALASLGDTQRGTKEGLRFKKHVLGWSAVMLFLLFQLSDPFVDGDDPHATHPIPFDRIEPLLAIWGITELGAYTPPWWELLLEIPRSGIRKLIRRLGKAVVVRSADRR